MEFVLRVAGIIGIIVSVIWWFAKPGFDPVYAFLTGFVAFLSSFIIPKQELKQESLDKRNRHVMLNHVENFWVKGVLEKSLYGAALLELGIKEDPSAVSYPWTLKRDMTNEIISSDKSMLEIFDEIGAGRSLLILGAPGSGKTTMLLELTRQLIERARQNETEPIPVVFNSASWTEKQTLSDWLAEQLNIIYFVPKKTALMWVNENKMFLLLDGLDEVKQDSRAKFIEAINQFRTEHGLTALVVCSRIEEYRSIYMKLSLQGAIALQPLTLKQVNAYFDKFGESLVGVKQLLKKDKVLQELAETPLMLGIMALAYKDKKPEELLSSNNKEDQRKHLFNIYIESMFERSTRIAASIFTKQQTLHSLGWLARKMSLHNTITYQIESMQPSWLENKYQKYIYSFLSRITFGLISGVALGAVCWVGSETGSIGEAITKLIGRSILSMIGLIIGLIGGVYAAEVNEIIMVDNLKWSWKNARNGFIIIALFGGLIIGLLFGLFAGLFAGLLNGLLGGLIVGLAFGLAFGWIGEQIEETTWPGQRLRRTFFNTIFIVAIIGLFVGLMPGMSGGLKTWLAVSLIYRLIVGLPVGLLGGLLFYSGGISLIEHYILRYVLIWNKFLPKQPLRFLEYAVDLIFLRRVGGSYIFVHRLLMEHFAQMDV